MSAEPAVLLGEGRADEIGGNADGVFVEELGEIVVETTGDEGLRCAFERGDECFVALGAGMGGEEDEQGGGLRFVARFRIFGVGETRVFEWVLALGAGEHVGGFSFQFGGEFFGSGWEWIGELGGAF